MAENRYVNFVEALIQKTKNHDLVWKYLDEYPDLCRKMGWFRKVADPNNLLIQKEVPEFNSESSFYAHDAGFRIVLYVYANLPADLYIIPSTYKRVLPLHASDYGEYITRLLNLVQSHFPDSEEYVDKLLKASEPTK